MTDYDQKSTSSSSFSLPNAIKDLLSSSYVSASPIVPLEADENGRTRRAPMDRDSLELDLCRHMLPLCYNAEEHHWEKAPSRSCYRHGKPVFKKECLTKANGTGWPKQLTRFSLTNGNMGENGEFTEEFVNHLDSLAKHALPTTPDQDAWSYGFLLGEGYIAIDCDLDDENLSSKLLSAFIDAYPDAPIRTRGGSRWASILYITDNVESDVDGMTLTFASRSEKPQQVEFLGKKKQLAIQGWHPSGSRYVLYRGDLTTVPETTQADIESLRSLLLDIAVTNGMDIAAEGSGRSKRNASVFKSTARIDWDGMNYGAGPGGICRSDVPIYTLLKQVMNDAKADHLRKSDLFLDEDDGKIYFKCPNSDEHTAKSGDKDTCYFKDGGGFKCLHAHCENYDFTHLFDDMNEPLLKTLLDQQYANLKEHKVKQKKGTDENGDPIYENVSVAYVESWKATPAAIRFYLTHEDFCPVRFSYDTFTQRHYVEFTKHGLKKELDDTVSTQLVFMLLDQNVAIRSVSTALDSYIRLLCKKNPFDSVLEYVESLPKWDGVKRVSDFFTTYTKCTSVEEMDERSEQWESACAQMLFTSLIGRMTDVDGIQSDTSIVLKGGQGIGKSTLCRILAGSHERFQELTFGATDKDRASSLAGKTVVEVAELAGMNKKSCEEIKSFLTTTIDKFRPSYGRYEVSRPRRCIFIFTTNEDRFLKDVTGSRRFAIVDLGEGKSSRKFDFDSIRKDYEQLMAEAKALYEKNGIMWQKVNEMSSEKNAKALELDPWEDSYKDALSDAHWTSMRHLIEIVCSRIGAQLCNLGKREKDRIGGIVRRLGFRVRNVKISGDVVTIYVREESDVSNSRIRELYSRGIYSDSKTQMIPQAPAIPSNADDLLFT